MDAAPAPQDRSIRSEVQMQAARISIERWEDAEGNERSHLTDALTFLQKADYALKEADEAKESEGR